MQFYEKQIDLFDITSFFAWTFLNFLARCDISRTVLIGSNKEFGPHLAKLNHKNLEEARPSSDIISSLPNCRWDENFCGKKNKVKFL